MVWIKVFPRKMANEMGFAMWTEYHQVYLAEMGAGIFMSEIMYRVIINP